jgi:hypothetical protein
MPFLTWCVKSSVEAGGIQAKKGKIDAAGVTGPGGANVAEIHHQALMMLAHEIFDPESNKRVLVDHAFIVAGGEITKAARNWIGNASNDQNLWMVLGGVTRRGAPSRG